MRDRGRTNGWTDGTGKRKDDNCSYIISETLGE